MSPRQKDGKVCISLYMGGSMSQLLLMIFREEERKDSLCRSVCLWDVGFSLNPKHPLIILLMSYEHKEVWDWKRAALLQTTAFKWPTRHL